MTKSNNKNNGKIIKFKKYLKNKKEEYGYSAADIAIGSVTAITAIILGTGLVYNMIESTKAAKADTENAQYIVELYSDENYYGCEISGTHPTYKTEDYKMCSGEALYDELASLNIKYCEIFDEYYTLNGEEVIEILYENEYEKEINGERIITTKTIKRVVLKRDYERLISSNYGKALYGADKTTIISATGKESKPYSEIIDQDLVIDLPENITLEDNKVYEGEFKLIKQ